MIWFLHYRGQMSNTPLCLLILLLHLHTHSCHCNLSFIVHYIAPSSSSICHKLLNMFVFMFSSSRNPNPNVSLSMSGTALGTWFVVTSASFTSPAKYVLSGCRTLKFTVLTFFELQDVLLVYDVSRVSILAHSSCLFRAPTTNSLCVSSILLT